MFLFQAQFMISQPASSWVAQKRGKLRKERANERLNISNNANQKS